MLASERTAVESSSSAPDKTKKGENGDDHATDDEEVAYGESDYWDQRYLKPTYKDYEWYLSYEKIKEHDAFKNVFRKGKETRMLQVGCGNSRLWLDLYNEGYKNQLNIDISKVVIDEMRQSHASFLSPTFQFVEMDARKMSLPDESFDFVFEKGTLDAVACSSDSYNNMFWITKECCRVLTVGGYFVSVTFAPEDMRLRHLTRKDFPWELEVTHISLDGELTDGSKQQYFIYKMLKKAKFTDRETPTEDLLAEELRASSEEYRDAEIELDQLRIDVSAREKAERSEDVSSASSEKRS